MSKLLSSFWRTGLGVLLSYIPILLLVSLVATSYWLLGLYPQPDEVLLSETELVETPDFFMQGVALRAFTPTGELQAQVKGEQIVHYPIGAYTKFTNPEFRIHQFRESQLDADAEIALVNADISEIQLFEQANITYQEPQLETMYLEGEFFHIFTQEEIIQTDKTFRFQQGNDILQAQSLHFDQLRRQLNTQGQVRATFTP